MYRDQAAERATKAPPLRDPDARSGDQGPAAGYPSASPLRPYYRERDRAGGGNNVGGWGDPSSAAAAATDSPRRTPPSEFAMSYPPPPRVLDGQRPPLRDEESWSWTAPTALRDQHYPTHRDFDDGGRRHFPNERWGSPAAVFSGATSSSSTSNWAGHDRDGTRGAMDEADDFYPVRGGAAVEGNQDWSMASSYRREGRPTGPWAFAGGGMADDMDAVSRTVKLRSANQDELNRDAEPKREAAAAAHISRSRQDPAHHKRPYRQEQQQKQQDTQQEYNYRQRLARESESDAIARLSAGRAATTRMRQSSSSGASPNQAASERMSVGSADSPMTPSDKAEAKTSRYLREIDRRNILARIDSGEKQSELAKEFQVTRAAICNLKKHRDVILSRVHGNPFAKHPKKSKLKPGSAQQQQRLAAATASAARKPTASGHAALRKNPLLFQVASRPALLHFQRLSDPKSSVREFRRICWRLMTLVVEEALAWVETAAFKRKSAKSAGSGSARGSETSSDSHESRDACAVMIKPEASMFPQIFRSLEPDAPRGRIHFGDFGGSSASSSLSTAASMEVGVDLPPELASSHVYLFHAVVTLARSAWIAQAVRALVERGAGEAFVCLVTVSIAAEAIAELQSSFPLLKIVTTHIDHPRGEETSLNQDERVIDQLAARVARDADAEDDS